MTPRSFSRTASKSSFFGALLCLLTTACASPAPNQTESALIANHRFDSMTRTAKSIAEEVQRRWATVDVAREAPLVINLHATANATERAVAELTATSYLAHGGKVASSCSTTCFELSVLDMATINVSEEQEALLSANDLVNVASSASPILGTLTRTLSPGDKKSHAIEALLININLRDGARYLQRQHFVAVVAPTYVPSSRPKKGDTENF